jgi:hypothetical protein
MTPDGVRGWLTGVLRLPWDYLRSAALLARDRGVFDRVETQCLFVGFPKSGHSLVGSLLDAHPDIIIAHEFGTLRYLLAGFSARQIYALLLANSREHGDRGRTEAKYSYVVPNQWQGRFETLRVIGDKHGEGLTLRLRARPLLFDTIHTRFPNVKFIHVIRNPFDIITSLTLPKSRRLDLDSATDYFSALCDTVVGYREQIAPERLCELRHEDLVRDPSAKLLELCEFLGVEALARYLADCESIIFTSPHKTREKREWSTEQISRVTTRLTGLPLFEGYSFDSP